MRHTNQSTPWRQQLISETKTRKRNNGNVTSARLANAPNSYNG